jgi:pimeloyl-ACP methyl ester carboxylesterase
MDALQWLVRDGVPPPVPPGRPVPLRGRGTTFVRELPGPPGAPTLLLLHGWMASGGLNWFRAFEALSTEFRVLAPDLRGHAHGIRSRDPFRLSDCADDVDALLTALDIGPVVVAGYSMGGSVGQLLYRRHRDRVAGLVLCATAPSFVFGPASGLPADAALGALAGMARLVGRAVHVPSIPLRAWRRSSESRPRDFVEWALMELRRHDVRMLVEAARASGSYDARTWLAEMDVPAAVVVTTRDRVVPAHAQLEFATLVEGTSVHDVDGGHAVCTRERFVAPLLSACRDVAARAAA